MIVGLGATGLSYARHISRTAPAARVMAMDASPSPERARALESILPGAQVGGLDAQALARAEEIFLSPGVPLATPGLQAALRQGVPIRGDLALFAAQAQAPLAAVTGTNGKSTVCQLLYKMAAAQRQGVRLGGNIGTPCLDVLAKDASLYVLEVSSYQLELAAELPTQTAVVLNLSPDHLDRYDTAADYYKTKLALYDHCRQPVVNRALSLNKSLGLELEGAVSFGLDEPPAEQDFGLRPLPDGFMLVRGSRPLVHSASLRLAGEHNLANVLAAIALGERLGLALAGMVETARHFGGLPHRGEHLGKVGGVAFVNDSKATNPGAMAASIKGFAKGRNLLLICGGQAKGLSFAEAAPALGNHVKQAFLIGQDAGQLAAELPPSVIAEDCGCLAEAVSRAYAAAQPGELVLLAPGCASFDQFADYMARGDAFRQLVQELQQ